MTNDIYSFRAQGRFQPSSAAYLAAVTVTAQQVLERAVELIPRDSEGEKWHYDLNDFLIEVSLCGEEAVREVLAFSPNLYKVDFDHVRQVVHDADYIDTARTEASEREAMDDVLGQIAYRAFEQDLWDAIWPLYELRFDGISEAWTQFFANIRANEAKALQRA